MSQARGALRTTTVALAGLALALTGAIVVAAPAHAADFPDVDTEAELNAAIQYAIDNPTDPVVADITGDITIASGIITLTAGSVSVVGNGHSITANSVSGAGFRAENASHLAIDSLSFDFYESGPVVGSAGTPADPAASPTVEVSDVTATAGAFDIAFQVDDTTFSLTTATIHDSETGIAGNFSFGTATLSDVTVLDPVDCGIAIGLAEDAALTATGLAISGAGCTALGVVATDTASATITDSQISDNVSGVELFNLGSGSIAFRDSAITGSTTDSQVIAIVDSGIVEITGSTISGGAGGGWPTVDTAVTGGELRISHTTITENAVSGSTPVIGVCSCVGGSIVLDHAIVAGNIGTDADNPDLLVGPDTAATIDWSLIGVLDPTDATALAAVAAGSGNRYDAGTPIDPDLGPLALNGGTTPNHLPNLTSPVINAGDPAFVAPPATDQRGSARISGGIVDIGSVEVQFTPTFSLSRTSTATGEQVTATGSGLPRNTTFTMVLNSTPVTLGTAISNASGALSFVFTVPASVSAGAHTVTATLAGNVVASAAITVTGLPDTGSADGPWLLVGSLLIAVGIGAIALRRGRA